MIAALFGAHVAGTLWITMWWAFFIVVAMGIALGVYAAREMKKLEDKSE